MPVDVCIVLPLDGTLAQARGCLEGVAALGPEPEFEVVIVADGAPWLAPLLELLDGDVDVIVNDAPQGPGAALRAALAHTDAALVAIVQDSAIPTSRCIAALRDVLQDPGVGTAYSASGSAGSESAWTAQAAMWRTEDARAVIAGPGVAEHPIAALTLALAERGLVTHAASDSTVDRAAAPPVPAPHGSAAELTIVIPTLDAASPRMGRCLRAIRLATDAPHEIVIVDNGAPPQGFTDPVNTGVRASTAPYVVVMNDDVEPLPGWWPPLRDALDAGAPVTFPMTVGGAMRTDFAAWCFAISQQTIARFGHQPGAFLDPTMRIWFQDTDLLVRLRAAGTPPELVSQSHIRHGLSQTVTDPEPELSAWVRQQIDADRRRFEAKHPSIPIAAAAAAA